MIAVRWYLGYGLSYRDVEELLVKRGVAVDHVTIYRWCSGLPAPQRNLCRDHYELATDVGARHRLAAAFAELALAV